MDRPDIQTVLQTLYSLYSDNQTDKHGVASRWLTELQNSVHAWEIAHQLLTLEMDTEYVNYFAANTMHSKVRDSFEELPKDMHMGLRDSLLHHLTSRGGKPSPVTMQLVLALADLSLQMDDWDTVIEDVIMRFSSDAVNVPTLLDLLVVLPEEINNRALHLGNNKRTKLTEMLAGQSRAVLELLIACLSHWPENFEIKTRVFSCLSSWIALRSFPVAEVAASTLMVTPFHTLHQLDVPEKLYEAAADCICSALYVCYDVSNYQSLALVLQQQVNQLLPVFLATIEAENHLRANCLARIFTEMADSFLYNIINYPDTPTGDIKTLDLLLQICKHYDYEMIDLTFMIWYRLSEMLIKLDDRPTSDRFINHINELIVSLTKHCQLNDDLEQTEVPDERGDFADFRRNVTEVMRDVVFVVGAVECFQKLYTILCTPGQPWNVTESCLFLMYSISLSIRKDESQVLPIAIPVLLSIPPSTHYAVRATTLRLIGELSHWICNHPEILNDVLKFFQDGLSIRPLASISAVGIQSICQKCKTHMANLFDGLLGIIQAADSLGISNNSVVGLMTGTVEVLLELPGEKVTVGLQGLCGISGQKLTEIVQSRPDVQQNTTNDPSLWMDRLSAVYRTCHYKPAPGEVHPALAISRELLPLIYSVLDIYKNDHRIVERSCRCLRFMLRCLRVQATPIVEEIITVSIQLYAQCYHSCYLYLGSIIVDEFGPDPANHPGLIAMTENFVQVSFSLLSGASGLIDHPDTVDDMFRLCARMMQRCPLAFLRSPVAITALQCGLAASLHMHKDAFTSVMKFFKDLAHAPFDNYINEPDISEVGRIVYQIMANNGQAIVNSLVKGYVSLPQTMLTESSVVLYELLQNYKEGAVQWLKVAVSEISSIKITEEQKMKFIESTQHCAQVKDLHAFETCVRDLSRIFR